jgi:hypothetical protein
VLTTHKQYAAPARPAPLDPAVLAALKASTLLLGTAYLALANPAAKAKALAQYERNRALLARFA